MTTADDYRKRVHGLNSAYPPHLVDLSPEKWGELDFIATPHGFTRVQMMRSATILAGYFKRSDGWAVLGVARTIVGEDGHHIGCLNWDEHMAVKRKAGLGRLAAFEVYPSERAVINVHPIRWLWFPPYQLPCFL